MGNQSGKSMDPAQNKKKIRITKILKRFEMCPAGNRSTNINDKDLPDSPQRPERRIYHLRPEDQSPAPCTKAKDSEWVDVPLDVPESPPRYIQLTMASPINNEIPKAPPRKHSRKKNLLQTATPNHPGENEKRKPVEEPIIVPKKQPVHICDGTHHHVDNYHHGRSHNNKDVRQENNSLGNEPYTKRQKTISVVSLPDYNQLSIKPNENEAKYAKDKLKSAKVRHASMASLPIDSKISFSAATAERLENYITKCKSFGSLRPQQVMDKLNIQEVNPESDSDDSWDGLDDWDLAVIENDFDKSSKVPPPYIPKSTFENQGGKTKMNSNTDESRHWNPHHISETDEKVSPLLLKTPRLSVVRELQGRRESIDDFFTSTAEPDTLNRQEIDELIKNCQVSRRGSEVIQGYDTKCYPFKAHKADPSFNSDSFFSSSLIENESHISNPNFPFKNTAKENEDNVVPQHPSHKKSIDNLPQKMIRRRSGSVNTSEIISHLQSLSQDGDIRIHEETNGVENSTENNHNSDTQKPTEANDHSNLLKIISENPLHKIPSPSKQTFESCQLSDGKDCHTVSSDDTANAEQEK